MSADGGASERPRGVVLAGGASTRFGEGDEDKALARVGTDRVVERVVTVLRDVTRRDPVVAVRTADQRARYDRLLGERVRFAADAPGFDGPLAGVVGAAAATDAAWLVCCGCDMPLLDPAAVGWLSGLLDGSAGEADAVAVEHPDGVVEPLHTLYRRERVLAVRDRLPATAGPRALLAELAVHVVPVAAVPEEVPIRRSTTNVNTRADLAAVRERSRES